MDVGIDVEPADVLEEPTRDDVGDAGDDVGQQSNDAAEDLAPEADDVEGAPDLL